MSVAFQVARAGSVVFVRVEGLANLKVAPLLDGFLASERTQGATQACIDLAGCTGMDSTFMGLLVGHNEALHAAGGRLVVVRSGGSNRKLLDMLGVSAVVEVAECQPPELEFVPLEGSTAMSAAKRAELLKRTHQSLSALSAENQAKFAGLLAAIDQDLAKQRQAVGPTAD